MKLKIFPKKQANSDKVCRLMCDDGWEQIRTVIRCKCHAKRGCEWFRPIRQCQPENEFEPTTQSVPAGGTFSNNMIQF